MTISKGERGRGGRERGGGRGGGRGRQLETVGWPRRYNI